MPLCPAPAGLLEWQAKRIGLLELQSQPKLHDSRVIRAGNFTITDIVRSIAGFSRKCHATTKDTHVIPLRVVERVERFPPELQFRSLTVEPGKGEILGNTH